MADRNELRPIILLKPRQPLAVGGHDRRPPPRRPRYRNGNIAPRCSRGRSRRVHGCRKPVPAASHSDRARVRRGSALAGPRLGSRDLAFRHAAVPGSGPLSRSSDKAISQKEGVDVRRGERSERIGASHATTSACLGISGNGSRSRAGGGEAAALARRRPAGRPAGRESSGPSDRTSRRRWQTRDR